MKFKNVKQEVFKLEDIESLVESIRVEVNENFCLCFDLELHLERLLKSIEELGFSLCVQKEEFDLFFLNQIKNKLQYKFNRQVAFTYSEFDDDLNLLRLSTEIYKLRLVYKKDGCFIINLDEYQKDLKKEWKVKILEKKEFHIDSSNPIWKHKFLPRPDFSFYYNQGFDEIIWTDENGNICEGGFTAIIFDTNKTPLANTLESTSLRKLNLEKKETKELKQAWLTNSLIGIKKELDLISIAELSHSEQS